MNNPETPAPPGTQDRSKTNKTWKVKKHNATLKTKKDGQHGPHKISVYVTCNNICHFSDYCFWFDAKQNTTSL